MKIISTSYSMTDSFSDPIQWLGRISFYTALLEELATRHDVAAIERIKYEGTLKRNGVQYIFSKLKRKITFFPARMHRMIKKMNPDTVLVNGLMFPLQVMQLRRSTGKNTRIVLVHRAEMPTGLLRRFFQRLADKYVDAYIFSSPEFGKEWVDQKIIRDHKKIYGLATATSSFYPGERNEAKKKLLLEGNLNFLWVGRLDANKNPLMVIRAFILFCKQYPLARLYMIFQTEDMLNEIEAYIKEEDAGDLVHLTGKVDHTQLFHWYNAADFFISGSYYESYGIAVCEAMSCGCIPLLTDIISFRKMTAEGKCGLLYEAGNERALHTSLLMAALFDREVEREKVLRQFKEELSAEAIAVKIENILYSLEKNDNGQGN